MTAPAQGRVALVWRGDQALRAKANTRQGRLAPVFAALAAEGLAAEPAIYCEEAAAEVRQQLLGMDAVLVWVDPISDGRDRSDLDASSQGAWVSAHPDVILKMGVKEVLYRTRDLLHELYFAGLGAPTSPGRPLATTIERDFGSDARWRAEFVAVGKALGGGSGWVILTWSRRDQRLVNQWAADHTMTLAGATPILVLDMYEHAYAIDYGAKAAAYVDAFMAAINWKAADAQLAKATA